MTAWKALYWVIEDLMSAIIWFQIVAGSTLELYKQALKLRHELKLGEGSFEWVPEFVTHAALGFQNGDLLVVHNFGHAPIKLPQGEVLASSLHGMTSGHDLVADQTVWLKL